MTVAGKGGIATARAEACCPGPVNHTKGDEPETLEVTLAHVARKGGIAKPEPKPAA